MDRRTLPTGVVTFVLTDVVGSTQLWERDPAGMERALARHDEVISEAVARRGGVLLKQRGEGDSTFSVFERASDGLHAAYDAQVELARTEWETVEPLRCRIAVHSGEAPSRDGDYVGVAVNRAARLRGVAEGGEVVVSAAVAELVADHLPLDAALVPLGEIRLRGLNRHEQAFALTGPGLDSPRTGNRGEAGPDLVAAKGVTRRERDVLDALAERLTNAEIAARFSVSERTVESHVSSLLRKLEVANRVELARVAQEQAQAAAPPELPPMLVRSTQRSNCIGRRAERAALLGCWDRAVRGETVLAVVRGEAGIGKSRLIADLAVEVHARGGRVLLGAANDGAPAPYQPLVEALTPVIDAATEHQLRADLGPDAELMARLFPSLSKRLGTFPVQMRDDTLADAPELQLALATFLARCARRQPTLVVIEDVHWASQVTRDVLLHAARMGGSAPLVLAVTTRDTAPDLDAALTGWLASAARLSVCETVTLDGLDLVATRTLIAELGGQIEPSEARHQTGGNPLLLREVAAADTASPTLVDHLANRYARLEDEDLDVVDTAAVLGETFSADVVAAATKRSLTTVLDSLERACRAGIVDALTPTDRRYAFVHALFRSLRYESLSAGRRMRLHAAVTEALLPRADDPAILHDLARHACIAAPLGDANQAVELARRAGAASAAASDRQEAIRHYRRALDIIDLAPQPDERVRLQVNIRLGEVLALNDKEAAVAILRDATRLARRLGDADAFADAVCSMSPWGGSLSLGGEDPTFIALAEEALALFPERTSAWRPRLLAVLASHLSLGLHPQRGRTLLQEALSIARELDDDQLIVHCAAAMSYTSWREMEMANLLEESFEISARHGYRSQANQAAYFRSAIARRRGDFDGMRAWAARAREYTLARPSPHELQYATTAALLDGDLERAERCNRTTAEELAPLGPAVATVYSGSGHIALQLWRGGLPRTGGLERTAELRNFVGYGARAMLALIHAFADRRDEAAAQLELLRAGFDPAESGMSWLLVVGMAADVASLTDSRTIAAELRELIEPYAGQLADSSGVVWCSIDLARAELDFLLGATESARAIAEHAVAASRARQTPLFLGRELIVLADAQRRLGESATVGPLVNEALAIADRTGALLIRRDAERRGLAAVSL